jgi:hypothetical protein
LYGCTISAAALISKALKIQDQVLKNMAKRAGLAFTTQSGSCLRRALGRLGSFSAC